MLTECVVSDGVFEHVQVGLLVSSVMRYITLSFSVLSQELLGLLVVESLRMVYICLVALCEEAGRNHKVMVDRVCVHGLLGWVILELHGGRHGVPYKLLAKLPTWVDHELLQILDMLCLDPMESFVLEVI